MATGMILIVEDDEYVSRMYERAFRLGGHETDVAYSGDEALKKLADSPQIPAALLLDVMMPNMNGLALLEAVRGQERFNAMPIVILTNSLHREDAEQFLSAGANLYLVKIEHQSKQVVEQVETLIREGVKKA